MNVQEVVLGARDRRPWDKNDYIFGRMRIPDLELGSRIIFLFFKIETRHFLAYPGHGSRIVFINF